ncbi:unnamed protein product [Litomosoides sigmodontis]|uniref:Uncharacterized protein n=1 Tax=Litomosoides sigmodontis TaxID=42156 RepID=A0A3P6T7M4_LITSI|nr:unnamed protein product [Litomosoides sigmodontis]
MMCTFYETFFHGFVPKKLLKRKRYSGREAVVVQSNQSKICGLKESSNNEGDMKQQQNACTSDSKKQLEANAPDNLILELQQRIGGSNEGALELLEQLKKCLIAGAVSSNIHLNPEVIRKNA